MFEGQQPSFRPFGLGQRPYLSDNLRELDSQRRKSDALANLHPSLNFNTTANNLDTTNQNVMLGSSESNNWPSYGSALSNGSSGGSSTISNNYPSYMGNIQTTSPVTSTYNPPVSALSYTDLGCSNANNIHQLHPSILPHGSGLGDCVGDYSTDYLMSANANRYSDPAPKAEMSPTGGEHGHYLTAQGNSTTTTA